MTEPTKYPSTIGHNAELWQLVLASDPFKIPTTIGAGGRPLASSDASRTLVVALNPGVPVRLMGTYIASQKDGDALLTWEEFRSLIKERFDAGARAANIDQSQLVEASTTSPADRPVLVTTEYRGVFFGYATDTTGDTIHLKRARNCISWSADVQGFLGLANFGPTKGCKVGPTADIDLRKITCVAEVTPEAVKAWEAAPWAK